MNLTELGFHKTAKLTTLKMLTMSPLEFDAKKLAVTNAVNRFLPGGKFHRRAGLPYSKWHKLFKKSSNAYKKYDSLSGPKNALDSLLDFYYQMTVR